MASIDLLAGKTAESASFPGPLITVNRNAHFKLNVIDSLTDNSMLKATSIVSFAFLPLSTTLALAMGYSNQVPDQAGTFWYHSHYSTQYCDGLRGVFVIYDPHDPQKHLYDVDNDDIVITLADWYHVPALEAGPLPTSNTTLINGKGRYAGRPSSPLAVISVVKGQRYRFRLVSVSCDPNFVFSIDGHTMASWIATSPTIGTTTFDGGVNSAILRYRDAPNGDPNTTQTPNSNRLLETNLHPLADPAVSGVPTPGAADVDLNLACHRILSGAKTAQDLLPPGSVCTLSRNKVVEVSIPGGTVGAPHAFSVIRSAGNSTYNFANP
ncbi:hypothetical protein C0995_001345, partial [Termitomyces sp. Mi166